MNVYANAFRLGISGPLPANNTFESLVEEGIQHFQHGGRDRVLAIEKTPKFFMGCLLTPRDDDSYLTLEQDAQGRPYAKRRQMVGGPAIHFAYFIIGIQKGNGIFTQYKGSGGLTQFANVLNNRHQMALEAAKAIAIQEAGEADELTESRRRDIGKHFRGRLDADPITTNPEFAKELKRLTRISRFAFVTAQLSQPWIRSIKDTVKYVRHSVSFSVDGPGSAKRVIDAIVQMVVGEQVQEGTAFGINSSGEQDHVTIHPENFCMASYRYKEIATDEIRMADFANNPVINRLLDLARTQPLLF